MREESYSNRKRVVVITGGLGFIGQHLLAQISNDFDLIIIVDNLSPTVHQIDSNHHSDRYKLIVGDVQEIGTWEKVSKNLPSDFYELTIFHLAADTSTGNSLSSPSAHVATNVLGTAVMCEFLFTKLDFLKRIILTSTRAVYGEGLWTNSKGSIVSPKSRHQGDLEMGVWNPRHLEEHCISPYPVTAAIIQPSPVNIYGSTKLSQESILQIWCQAFDVELRIYRLQNVYGPGQSLWNSYSGVISLFAKNALTGQAIEVYEGGGIVRDLVYVKDIARVLASEVSIPDRSTIIDVGSGVPTSLHEVASFMAKRCGADEPVITNKFRLGDVRGIFADNSEVLKLEIFPEFTSLEVGISELLDWAKEEIKREGVK